MSTISDRADRFAKKLRPQAPADDRTPDQKVADVKHNWDLRGHVKKARKRAQEARNALTK